MAELQIKNFHWQSVHLNEPKEKSRLGRSVLAAMPVAGLSQLWLLLGIFIVCFRRIVKPCYKPNRHPEWLAQRPQDMLNLFRNSLLARYVAII